MRGSMLTVAATLTLVTAALAQDVKRDFDAPAAPATSAATKPTAPSATTAPTSQAAPPPVAPAATTPIAPSAPPTAGPAAATSATSTAAIPPPPGVVLGNAPPSSPAAAAPSIVEPPRAPRDAWLPAQHDKTFALRVTGVLAVPLARPYLIDRAGAFEVDALYRARLGVHTRLDVGGELRTYADVDTRQWTIGVPLDLVFELGRYYELELDAVPDFTWIVFDSRYFEGTSGPGLRAELGMQWPIGGTAAIGLSPLAFHWTFAPHVKGPLAAYEPRLWLGFAF